MRKETITINILIWVFFWYDFSGHGYRFVHGPGILTPGFVQDWYRARLPWFNGWTGERSTIGRKFTKAQIKAMRKGW